MKHPIFIPLLCLFFCCATHAEIPEKKNPQFYSKLWTNSPFTTKPIDTRQPPAETVFNDYHLTGIAPVEGGHRITITHKKNIKDKIIIEPGSKSKFQVISVNRNPETRLGTIVTLTDGRVQGEVRFEPTLVVLNAPMNANPQIQGQAELPPGVNPNQPNNAVPAPNITPRPRVITPKTSSQTPATNNTEARPKRVR
jgi:hypothetical protein